MLKKLRKETVSNFVFGNGRPLGSFRKAWYSACVKAGLGRFEELGDGSHVYVGTLFHDLRRSAIMNMMQGGIDPTVAKAISGHETDSVFKRYNIVTEARLIDASKKADAFIEAQRQALTSDTVVRAEVIHPALPEAKSE